MKRDTKILIVFRYSSMSKSDISRCNCFRSMENGAAGLNIGSEGFMHKPCYSIQNLYLCIALMQHTSLYRT